MLPTNAIYIGISLYAAEHVSIVVIHFACEFIAIPRGDTWTI